MRTTILIVAALLLAGAVALHVRSCTSTDCDLEMALGVERLPPSVSRTIINVDAWQDYSVRAYFEANASDMRTILSSRAYETESINSNSFVCANPMRQWLPTAPEFETASYHQWKDGSVEARAWVNGGMTKAFVLYSARNQ